MDMRLVFEELKEVLKICLLPCLLCPRQRNTIGVQMFKVFGRAGASRLLSLSS